MCLESPFSLFRVFQYPAFTDLAVQPSADQKHSVYQAMWSLLTSEEIQDWRSFLNDIKDLLTRYEDPEDDIHSSSMPLSYTIRWILFDRYGLKRKEKRKRRVKVLRFIIFHSLSSHILVRRTSNQ
jgi:hypothetical protein